MGEDRGRDDPASGVGGPSPGLPSGFDLGLRDGEDPPFSDHVLGYGAGLSERMPEALRVDPRDADAEGWAIGPDGQRMWGRLGAAGLLAIDRDRGVLLQHRAKWSHFGNTWGIPGGAIGVGETAFEAALREADEEASVPADALDPLATRIVDLGFWSYTTVVAETVRHVRAAPRDEESAGVAWVAPKELPRLRLHPHFERAWPALEELLGPRPVLVVDAANVVGSVPDGWWRDRPRAAASLAGTLAAAGAEGLPASIFGLDADRVWPRIILVLEGAARRAPAESAGRLELVRAEGHGDDAIVAAARGAIEDVRSAGAGASRVLVATSDRELRVRVGELGALTVSSRRLRDALPLEPDAAGRASAPSS